VNLHTNKKRKRKRIYIYIYIYWIVRFVRVKKRKKKKRKEKREIENSAAEHNNSYRNSLEYDFQPFQLPLLTITDFTSIPFSTQVCFPTKNYVPIIENIQLYISRHVRFSCMRQFFDISCPVGFPCIFKSVLWLTIFLF
jgi:hypothetical protein